nr:uncharacterized protein LOC123750299 [Procambarus clarkii]
MSCSPRRTYSFLLTQWAAVSTQREATSVPPQNASCNTRHVRIVTPGTNGTFLRKLSLAQKKKAVEDVELQKRSREEQQHTIQEMLHYLTYYKKKREILTEHTKELCGIFPLYLSKDPNKYTIEEKHLSPKNNSGILALLKQGQKLCTDKLITTGLHCLACTLFPINHITHSYRCETERDKIIQEE